LIFKFGDTHSENASVERHVIDAREHLTLRTTAGDSFTIVKPLAGEELLAKMRSTAREILDEERGRADGAGGCAAGRTVFPPFVGFTQFERSCRL
jgi:hypothetical protein